MWINCDASKLENTNIKYMYDEKYFYINALSSSVEMGQNSKLYANFMAENKPQLFDIGNFIFLNNNYKIDKKYSISYLQTNNIDVNTFSHFTLQINGKNIDVFPVEINSSHAYNDESIVNARQTLESLKNTDINISDINFIIKKIRAKTDKYKIINLPVANDFIWHEINNPGEYFELTSLKHLICSEGYIGSFIDNPLWYFGVSKDERLYAMAVKCIDNDNNPLTNADDCAVKFTDIKTNVNYYAVGILLLDDGQYFCKLH